MHDDDSQKTLGSPYTDPRAEALLGAANDSARLFRSIFLAFLLVSLYFLVLALSADDELLFKDGDLRAPILNVTVQASHYFMAAPWILVLLHMNFLIQGVFLSRKLADYKQALPSNHETDSEKELLRLLFPIPWAQMASGVSSSGVPFWMLKAFVFFTVAILPLATLGAMQIQFLDFQSMGITTMHSGVLLMDLLLLWFLWHRMNCLPEQASPHWGWRRRLGTALRQSWLSFASTLLMVIVFLTVSIWRPPDVGDSEEADVLGDWLRCLRLQGDSSMNTGMECGENVKARATTRFHWCTLPVTRDAAEAALLPSRSRKPGTGTGHRLAFQTGQGTKGKVCWLRRAATVQAPSPDSRRPSLGAASRYSPDAAVSRRALSRVNAVVPARRLTRAAAEARMRRGRWSRGRATS